MSTTDDLTVDSVLGYEVLVSETIPLALPDRLPNGEGRTWAPISTTLVYGERDAVLIDPPLTASQAVAIGDRVEASGKRLTHILATHAHGDHWFTADVLAGRFPGAQVTALAATIEQMHRVLTTRKSFSDKILPGRIPASPVTAVSGGAGPVGHPGQRGQAVVRRGDRRGSRHHLPARHRTRP